MLLSREASQTILVKHISRKSAREWLHCHRLTAGPTHSIGVWCPGHYPSQGMHAFYSPVSLTILPALNVHLIIRSFCCQDLLSQTPDPDHLDQVMDNAQWAAELARFTALHPNAVIIDPLHCVLPLTSRRTMHDRVRPGFQIPHPTIAGLISVRAPLETFIPVRPSSLNFEPI